MRVVWTDPALWDREQIFDFIAQDNPDAAVNMDDLFTVAAASLATLPERGRPGRVPRTRELLVHKHFILVYGIDRQNETVYIVAVMHTSRKYPPSPV